jgi:large subunit ribosomal protein L9
MKVILKENIESLGKVGDLIKVADGYARNYLIPKGMAVEASGKNVRMLEHEKMVVSSQAEKERKKAEAMIQKVAAVDCTITRRLGSQEKMFGSITAEDIAEALKGCGLEIDKKNIVLDEPIKALGDFPVKVKLHPGISAEFQLHVVEEKD